jgi:sulfur relay (sulfurtransferase) DsrC/TusE family protein
MFRLRSISRQILQIQKRPYTSTFKEWRQSAVTTMATPSAIHLTPNDTGVVRFEQATKESAEMASMLLQKNHDVSPMLKLIKHWQLIRI